MRSAHVMPKAQLHEQLEKELGEGWRDHFLEFDDVPIAAASIGQVRIPSLNNPDVDTNKFFIDCSRCTELR